MENIEVNAIKPEFSSEQKSQVTELGGDGLLNDRELEAVCGGRAAGGGGAINIDLAPVITATTDSLARVWRGSQSLGRSIYDFFAPDC
ncbi:hypothetical protein [Microcoleus sp. N9_A1]|uniref:hypothetical protein n=1 Tax=Microcoleus sp. N9_A1 TaxID=3055380 RepID=UPI002FD27ACC